MGLKEHMRNFHPSQENELSFSSAGAPGSDPGSTKGTYRCTAPGCSVWCRSEEGLKEHMRNFHPSVVSASEALGDSSQSSRQSVVPCSQPGCDRTFTSINVCVWPLTPGPILFSLFFSCHALRF